MKPLLMIALALGGCARPPACYRANSKGRGWQRVDVPAAAPSLAAPIEVEQIRSDESVVVWSDWQRGEFYPRLGSSTLNIRVPEDADYIDLWFAAPLAGAGVEVVGQRSWSSYSIQLRTRMHGQRLRFAIEPGTDYVVVTVHHHLRAVPKLNGWRSGYRVPSYDLPAQLRRPGSLYYFAADDRAIELCDAPERILGANGAILDGSPREAVLHPTLLTRVLHR